MTAEQVWSENVWGSSRLGSSSGVYGDYFPLKNLTDGEFVGGQSHEALQEPRCSLGTDF